MLTTKYTTWDELCEYIRTNLNINFSSKSVHPLHKGLGIDGNLPFSISEYEFNFIKDFIMKHNLKNGFELATGTGISTISIGWALKQNNGKLMSMDSYDEEDKQYVVVKPELRDVPNSDTPFKRNEELLKLFDLQNTVTLKKGWSPHDSENYIKQQSNKLDFVFLDCPKSTEDFIRDATYLTKYINTDKFAIFVHDTHCFMDDFNKLGEEMFGIKPIQKYNFNFPEKSLIANQTFPLSVITNISTI